MVTDAVMAVSPDGHVGMAVIGVGNTGVAAMLDALEIVVQTGYDTLQGRGQTLYTMVYAQREGKVVGAVYPNLFSLTPLPSLPGALKGGLVGISVSGIAVEEKVLPQAQVVGRPGEVPIPGGEFIQSAQIGRHVVVIAEDVVNAAMGRGFEQSFEPLDARVDSSLEVRQTGPAEVDDVTVEHEELTLGRGRMHRFRVMGAAGAVAEEMQVGEGMAFNHLS